MANMRLITWNTQGSIFNNQSKKQAIIELVKNYQFENSDPVFFIQEAGREDTALNDTKFWNDMYMIKTYPPYQSEKSICCLAFMYPKTKIKTKFEDYKIDTSQLSRPVACLKTYDGTLIMANIHATPSSPPNLDDHSKGASDICSTIEKLSIGTTPWLIIGDMNCPPDELLRYSRFASLKDKADIISPDVPTHDKNILDYVIASKSVSRYVNCVGVMRVNPSDHDPVLYNLNI